MNILSSFSRIFNVVSHNKGLTFINVTGLSIGLAVSMFLLVYLNFEYSYDRHFKDADRVYRTVSIWEERGQATNYPICLAGLAPALIKEVPEVETAARLFPSGNTTLKHEDQSMTAAFYEVDSTFLNIFNFVPVYGKLEHALDAPGKCIITRATAERFFGVNVNPVGKSLSNVDYRALYEVVAVIENVPSNTHFKFDFLIKLPDMKYNGLEYFTYVKFRPGTDYETAIEKCNAVNKRLLSARFEYGDSKFSGITEPLLSLHTDTQASWDLTPGANKSNLIFVTLVVVFILVIAVCNFISLNIIQGEKRATEICVRKTNGADRKSVAKMLFGETFFITLVSFVLAVVFYFSFSGLFGRLINFRIPEDIGLGWMMWSNFILLFFATVLIAGGYPAYYLSRFSPSELVRKTTARKYKLTAASVVVQFSVVIFCVSAMFIVMRQLDYMKNLPLGFDPDNVLTVRVGQPIEHPEGLRTELMQYPEIKGVAFGENPVAGCSGQSIRLQGGDKNSELSVEERRVGSGYLDLYKIQILQGRNFSDNQTAERFNLVLSESAVKALGLADPVGKKIMFVGDQPFTIIGVAQDIHYTSAHKKIGNLVYSARDYYSWTLSVRYGAGDYRKAKEQLLSVLDKRYKEVRGVEALSDIIDHQYWQDKVTFRILMSGTVLAIVLALLGLLALSGFVVRQKRKEISVRRVLGAQVGGIVYGLNRYIFVRILPAVPVGVALSYYAMSRWLQNFEYSISLTWWIFALALLLTFFVVLLTIMYQSLKSAMANPVEALKRE